MDSGVVKRAYRYRFYPTAEQAGLLNRTFGSVRYVYNRALAERSRAWAQEQRQVTFADTCRMLTRWKSDPQTAWLYKVSNVALQQGRAGRACLRRRCQTAPPLAQGGDRQ